MRMAAPTLTEKIQTREEKLRMAKEKLSSVLLSLRRKWIKRKKLQEDSRSMKVAQKKSMMQGLRRNHLEPQSSKLLLNPKKIHQMMSWTSLIKITSPLFDY
jgi:hypothetical protein